jgi:hypothetical protein
MMSTGFFRSCVGGNPFVVIELETWRVGPRDGKSLH